MFSLRPEKSSNHHHHRHHHHHHHRPHQYGFDVKLLIRLTIILIVLMLIDQTSSTPSSSSSSSSSSSLYRRNDKSHHHQHRSQASSLKLKRKSENLNTKFLEIKHLDSKLKKQQQQQQMLSYRPTSTTTTKPITTVFKNDKSKRQTTTKRRSKKLSSQLSRKARDYVIITFGGAGGGVGGGGGGGGAGGGGGGDQSSSSSSSPSPSPTALPSQTPSPSYNVDKLLSRDSEILVPVPLPSWETTIVSDDRVSSTSSRSSSTMAPPSRSTFAATTTTADTTAETSINDISIDNVNVSECQNDTFGQDFGLACLKKGLILGGGGGGGHDDGSSLNSTVVDGGGLSARYQSRQSSRHFSVPSMMFDKPKQNPNFKTPAQTARQMYNKNYGPQKPYGSAQQEQPPPPQTITTYQQLSPNTVLVQSRNPFQRDPPKPKYDPQAQEDLELLDSLKSSLGVLYAQSMNVKQRTMMLLREAKRRKLLFFDGLLMRTHGVISERQMETKRAMEEIDMAMARIRRQQQMSNYMKYRRNLQLQTMENFGRFPNGMRKPRPQEPKLDQSQIDRLMMDGLNHAKYMMTTVRYLNEALDDFEDQFNFPRFEPNTIEDYLKETEL